MVEKRALLIDGQAFQSSAFHRGIGKYSMSLLGAIGHRLDFYEKKIILLNKSNPLSQEQDEVLRLLAKGFEIISINYELLQGAGTYERVRDYNMSLINRYIAESLSGYSVDFLILSLFQEQEVPVFPTISSNNYLIMYDLIPLQFFTNYLRVESVSENYLCRFDTLMQTDHFFPISTTVANDLTLHLGIPKNRITPIYGAPIKRKLLKKVAKSDVGKNKFILMPSGDDFRKNNQRAALAFSQFNSSHNDEYKLVITSAFSQQTKDILNSISSDIIFTGNISDEELAGLYSSATCVLFPTEYEGLGLPVLEAIEFNKKIVCSDLEVFREITEEQLYFCDPYDVQSIASAIEATISTSRPIDSRVYNSILDFYSWDKSAELVATTLLELTPENRMENKPKIAIFGPSPRGFSAIGKIIQEQHYILSRQAEVTYYLEDGITDTAKSIEIRKNYLPYVAECRNPWIFSQSDAKRFDKLIYHIGNGEYHVVTLIKALSFPDQVVLHDTRLQGLYGVVRDQGFISGKRYDAERSLSESIASSHGNFLGGLMNKQKRVIVHSLYAKSGIEEYLLPGKNVEIVLQNLAVTTPYHVQAKNPSRDLLVAMPGIMTEAKGLDLTESLVRSKINDRTISVKIFGFSLLDSKVENRLNGLKGISVIKSPSDTRFMHELTRSDIMLSFRHPYHGETSLSTLEALRFGKATIVNNSGWFAELPDDIVRKVSSTNDIVKAVASEAGVAKSEFKDAQIYRAKYIEDNFSPVDYISRMLDNKELL